MLKQMIAFNKAAFDNGFNAILALQEQNEKMVNSFLGQAGWIPEEGRKVITDWVHTYKKGCEDFKKMADDNYAKVEKYFESNEKASS
jgi:hypothetical protein